MLPLDNATHILVSDSGTFVMFKRTQPHSLWDNYVQFVDAYLNEGGWLRIERASGSISLYPPSAVQRIDLKPRGDE